MTTDQIASEAREKILALGDVSVAVVQGMDAIIQTAIEKAREPLLVFIRRCADHMICGSNIADTPLPTEQEWRDILGEYRAAQASECEKK